MDSVSKLEMKLFSLITQLISLNKATNSDPPFTLLEIIFQILSLVSSMDFDRQPEKPKSKFISVNPQIDSIFNFLDLNLKPRPRSELMSFTTQTVPHFKSLDLDSQPKQISKLMLLTTQTVSIFNSMNLYFQPKQLRELVSLITQSISLFSTMDSDSKLYLTSLVHTTLNLKPEPEIISVIRQIFSLVIYMNSKWTKLISLCPQEQVILEEGKFHADKEVEWHARRTNDKWHCLPGNWEIFKLPGEEEDTHFRCRGCNGDNHNEHNKAPVEIKHPLHRKHFLNLVLFQEYNFGTRMCYCCGEDLIKVLYYCSACDFAMNFSCVEKPRVLSVDHPKWHEHTLALFPRQASLTCNLCALADSSCPFYVCPPCDFVVHQSCISLPSVIRISRHPHRISFTSSFDRGDWPCNVCRRKIDNDHGGYSCIKNDCLYAVHSKCATQSNVWDGIELEGEPEEFEEEEEEVEPFVMISDGIIEHFSHKHHYLRLDENIDRDYNENKLCQACIMPIYFGNFYYCMQCDYILHERCANLSRKTYHPIHPHMLTLVTEHVCVRVVQDLCSACPWMCTTGFFYECGKADCRFKIHVQCAKISEPLVHESHRHPLFLTSKPKERRKCWVCTYSNLCFTNETFNCIECDFALCFGCATLPQKVRYKHDKHMLTLSYGKETSIMKYWCEVCERMIEPKERFYICDEYCCVTLHIGCMLGVDLYMKPDSSWIFFRQKVHVLSNNHMTRPICSYCEKRCLHKIVFEFSGLMFCSQVCIRGMKFKRRLI